MFTRGIRGAITVEMNNVESLKSATVDVLEEMLKLNSVNLEDISHVVFSLTTDLDCAFPAKFAREELNFEYVPMECYQELNVPAGLKKCLRVLMTVNTLKTQKELKHVYLKGASVLRPDIV